MNNNLQEKLEQLRKAQKLKELENRISDEIKYLKEYEFDYTLFYKAEHLNWIANNIRTRNKDGYKGSHGDFQIDVNDDSALEGIQFAEEELTSEKFKEQLLNMASMEDAIIICRLGGDPEIEITLAAFLTNLSLFLSAPENWILAKNKKWLLEYLVDQNKIRIINIETTPNLLSLITISQ